jgi:predicted GNAT family N-acyltransferase
VISIRSYRPDDKSACLAIYFENVEKQLVPAEYREEFEEALEDSSIATVVGVTDERVVACGGICYYHSREEAGLSYGLVHPEFQRRRIGTSILLARLSLLEPSAKVPCDVSLTATQYSKTFFMRYGFGWCCTSHDQYGNVFETFRLPFTPQMVQRCKDTLVQSKIEFTERPLVPLKN